MKFQIKAISVTLILASLLGACSSVNSSNPSVEDPSVTGGIELESSEGFEGLETSEQSIDTESAEMDDYDLEASEEPMGLDSAEIENPELEESEEPMGLDSAEIENPELETAGQETPELESSEAPLESESSELILPVEDAVETPTESEAAENPNLESAE